MERADTPTTVPGPVPASQRFAAMVGLDWTGPTDEQSTEFKGWLADGDQQHAALAANRAPRAA